MASVVSVFTVPLCTSDVLGFCCRVVPIGLLYLGINGNLQPAAELYNHSKGEPNINLFFG